MTTRPGRPADRYDCGRPRFHNTYSPFPRRIPRVNGAICGDAPTPSRSGFMLRIALSAVLGGTLIAGFAHAQPSSYFGFGEAPPRPPAGVPNGTVPPQPPPPPTISRPVAAPPWNRTGALRDPGAAIAAATGRSAAAAGRTARAYIAARRPAPRVQARRRRTRSRRRLSRSPTTRSSPRCRRKRSKIRARCLPASTRSPAGSFRLTLRSARPCNSAR